MSHIKSLKKSANWSDTLFLAIVYGVVILVTVLCLYPMYFTVIASFSDPYEIYRGNVSWLPVGITMDAYTAVLRNSSVWRGYANTIYYTVAGTVLNLALTVPCAYALSKQRMYGRTFLMTLFIITMYFSGGMIPTYILLNNLDLLNTRMVMILSGGVSVYNLVVTRTYFQNNIPETLYEAAKIDGASEFRVFLTLVIPLSAPIIAVIALYYAVAHWSGYFNAMIYLTDQELHPLQLVLRRILILNESAYADAIEVDASGALLEDAAKKAYMATIMKYALVFIGSLPMLIAYPFVQKFFVKGIMIGSLKG